MRQTWKLYEDQHRSRTVTTDDENNEDMDQDRTAEEEDNGISVTIACPGKINTPISTNALGADGQKHGQMDHNQETGMPVGVCVSQLLKALSKKKREVLIGNKEIKAVTLKRFLPALFWRIIKKQSAT